MTADAIPTDALPDNAVAADTSAAAAPSLPDVTLDAGRADRSPVRSGRGGMSVWLMLVSAAALLVAGGWFFYAATHTKKPHPAIYAPVTVSLATADAQMAATRAKASAAAAKHAVASIRPSASQPAPRAEPAP
jgi:hypothetical protein